MCSLKWLMPTTTPHPRPLDNQKTTRQDYNYMMVIYNNQSNYEAAVIHADESLAMADYMFAKISSLPSSSPKPRKRERLMRLLQFVQNRIRISKRPQRPHSMAATRPHHHPLILLFRLYLWFFPSWLSWWERFEWDEKNNWSMFRYSKRETPSSDS